MITTCFGWAAAISVAESEELAAPAREAFDVARRGDRLLIPVRGVHPPPEVGAVGEGEEGRSGPPPPAPEGPGRCDQVDREPRPDDGAAGERQGQGGPRSGRRLGHATSISPVRRPWNAEYIERSPLPESTDVKAGPSRFGCGEHPPDRRRSPP